MGSHRPWNLLIALALVGAVVSSYLAWMHHEVRRTDSAAGLLSCGGRETTCLKVIESSDAEILGVPLASFGFVFYAGFTLVALVCRLEPERRGPLAPACGLAALAAVVFSLHLAWVSFFVLDAICPFCSLLHLVNLALLLNSLLINRRLFSAGLRAVPLPNPDMVICLVALAGATFLGLGLSWRNDTARYFHRSGLDRLLLDATPGAAVATAGRPALGDPQAPVTVVAFFDYGCPHCAVLDRDLRAIVESSAGRARLVVRNYPLERACNPAVGRSQHDSACAAAVSAEAVFRLAGADAFWRYHEQLLGQDLPLPRRLATIPCPVSPTPAQEAAARDAVERDVSDGNALGVRGTPYLFINGHPVGGRVRKWAAQLVIEELCRSAVS